MSEIRLPPGELERLAACVLEPIRFPGAVQPHGALLALDRHLTITQVSENSATILGAEPLALLGRGLAELVGNDAVGTITEILDPWSTTDNPLTVTLGDREFDVVAHELGGHVVVEFELAGADVQGDTAGIRSAMRRITNVRTAEQLWHEAAAQFRRITGFDRVMVYHFHPDGHGEIVGESKADDMEPYLGLHFPASDIPAQARELYLSKLSRMIVDSSAQPAALLLDANQPGADPFDLSLAELRAVSPHHLQFMRNMGQASTFSLSIIRNGELVGMITCAHRTVRRIPYGVRDGLEIFANQIALQLTAMTEISRLGRRNQIREIRSVLLRQVAGTADLEEALLRGQLSVLDLVPAASAVMVRGGSAATLGPAPDADYSAVGHAVMEAAGSLFFASNTIQIDHPAIAELLPGVAGILVHPVGKQGDYLAWLRGEVVQTVTWLGDMAPENRLTPLSPRNSFSSWSEEVTGTALPWGDFVREVRELGRDLDSALLQRAESQLAELALHDPLTSLPNRRLLMDRLEDALGRRAAESNLAVLFIDLDRFKEINDTLGHASGDAALVRVADSLRRAARASDTVARLGGDEFVVLCENTTFLQAKGVAARILTAVEGASSPVDSWHITASVGIAMADGSASASQILSAADAAMYNAKLEGGNRAMASGAS